MGDNESQNASFDTSNEPNASFMPNMTPVDLPYTLKYTETGGGQTASYDPNMSRVDTGAIRETSAAVRAKLRDIEGVHNALQSALKSLEACWDGPAADEYIGTYQALLGGLEQMYNTYAAYPNLLDENAEVREAADAQATMYAVSIELPQWAQV